MQKGPLAGDRHRSRSFERRSGRREAKTAASGAEFTFREWLVVLRPPKPTTLFTTLRATASTQRMRANILDIFF